MENIVYYLALFLLVFGIRFFKLKKQYKKDFKNHLQEVLHVSLDLVYTASGIVIALLLNIGQSWLGPVLIIYLLFVIFSALIEMAGEDEFTKTSKTIIHGIIVFLIILLSVLSYTKFIPKVDINGNKVTTLNQSKFATYKIIIPYEDPSLIKHIGHNSWNNRKLYYSELISGSNLDSLRKKVINNLYETQKPMFKSYNLQLIVFENETEAILIDKK